MRQEALNEIERRFDLLCKNATPGTIAYGTTGSKMRFEMALNLLGGEMGKSWSVNGKGEELTIDWVWTDESYKDSILTEDEYYNGIYDAHLTSLHQKLLSKFK
jgi:hypothetical protein